MTEYSTTRFTRHTSTLARVIKNQLPEVRLPTTLVELEASLLERLVDRQLKFHRALNFSAHDVVAAAPQSIIRVELVDNLQPLFSDPDAEAVVSLVTHGRPSKPWQRKAAGRRR